MKLNPVSALISEINDFIWLKDENCFPIIGWILNCGYVDVFIIFEFSFLSRANENIESSEKSSNKSESEVESGELLIKLDMIDIWNVNFAFYIPVITFYIQWGS